MAFLLRDVFDRARGWNYSDEDLPVYEVQDEETVYYLATLYGIEMVVYQAANAWGEDWPDVVTVAASLSGEVELDPAWLLACNSLVGGLPSIGLDENGAVVVQASFPLSRNFPAYLARKQVVTCLGFVASRMSALVQTIEATIDEAPVIQDEAQTPSGSGFVDKAARFAGIMIGQIIKEGMRDD